MKIIELNIRVTGEAGQGIDTYAQLIAKSFTRMGYFVLFANYVESRIRGGINHSQIRISDEPIWAIRDKIDYLIALSQAGFNKHCAEGDAETLILFSSEKIKPVDQVEFRGRPVPIPFIEIAKEDGGVAVMANVVAAAATLTLAGVPLDSLNQAIEMEIGKKVDENIASALRGKKFVETHFMELITDNKITARETRSKNFLLTGNEVLAMGAIVANCRFIAGYPMTPATSILEFFFKKMDKLGLVAVQAESEDAAMNMVVGASYMGVRAMTATSGGGFDLMTEALSLAGMSEIPVVVVDSCRPGPSTGLPTRSEQSELFLAIHGGHGEFPRVVLAPKDAVDAFYLVQKAFNFADKYQTPVIVLSNQYLSMSSFTISEEMLDFGKIQAETRKPFMLNEETRDYCRYLNTTDGISPWLNPGDTEEIVLATGDEHTEQGYYTEEADLRVAMQDKRLRKEMSILDDIEAPEIIYPNTKPELIIVGWGSTYGTLKEVVLRLTQSGKACSLVHFNQLWPFPRKKVLKVFDKVLVKPAPILVIEENSTGQLNNLLRCEIGLESSGTILRYDGRPFTVDYLWDKIMKLEVE